MISVERRSVPRRSTTALYRAAFWATRPLSRRGSLYALAAALLVLLNLADLYITRQALAHGASELNPIARYFVDHTFVAYLVKLCVPAAVLLMASSRRAEERLSEVHIAAIWTIVGMYLMTVFLNLVTWARYA
jgi:hypothetical protein